MCDFIFSAYDMALLYNCSLLVNSVMSVKSADFKSYLPDVKTFLKSVLVDPAISENLHFVREDWSYNICAGGCYFSFNNTDDVFIGYSPDLLSKSIVSRINPIEHYLFGIAIQKDFVDLNSLDDIDFCLDDDGIIYFPLPKKNCDSCNCDVNPCSSLSANGEENLDICHSLIVSNKMFSLIFSVNDKIIEKLNKLYKKDDFFTVGDDFIYKGTKCGKFINFGNTTKSLYFGLSPNVFYEAVVTPQSAIVTDYFSSVAILREFVKSDTQSSLIKNGAEFGDKWWYFPICRKLLCNDNYEELYINRVVSIILEGLKL